MYRMMSPIVIIVLCALLGATGSTAQAPITNQVFRTDEQTITLSITMRLVIPDVSINANALPEDTPTRLTFCE